MNNFKIIFAAVIFLLTASVSFSQQGWQRINEYYPYNFALGEYLGANTAYITSDFMKGVLKTTDKGATWKLKGTGINQSNVPLTSYLNFFDENTGILAGEYGLIYKTTNGAESWKQIFTYANGSAVGGVSFINANTGYAAQKFAEVLLKTTDGGDHWFQVGDTARNCSKLLFLNENVGFRVRSQDYQTYIYERTLNGGITWATLAMPETAIINMKKLSDTEFLYLNSKRIYKVSNNGNDWQLLASSSDEYPFSYLDIVNSSNFIVTCSNKLILATTDGGATWLNKSLPASGFVMTNELQESIIAGGSGIIFKSSPHFNNFVDINANKVTEKILNYQILDADNIFLYADSNYIIKSSDGGNSWNKLHLNFSPNSYSFINLNTGYAAFNKNICKTTDGGVSWDTIHQFTNSQGFYTHTSDINFITPLFGMVTYHSSSVQSYNYVIYYTTDAGETWNTIHAGGGGSGSSQSGSSSYAENFQMKSDSKGYYVSHYTYYSQLGSSETYDLKKTTNRGENWVSIMDNLNATKVYALSFINENIGFAETDSLKLKKTIDGGLTWETISVLPFSLNDFYMVDEQNGFCKSTNSIYHTGNAGVTWENQSNYLITSGSNSNYKIKFLNSQLGYYIGGNGEIFKTTTGGTVFINSGSSMTADKYFLSQNYPNPFNPETKIQFSIPKNGLVKIVVYDLLGREVKELVNEFRKQGSYNVSFNGTNLSSGIYFYKLITDDFVETKKMILVK